MFYGFWLIWELLDGAPTTGTVNGQVVPLPDVAGAVSPLLGVQGAVVPLLDVTMAVTPLLDGEPPA